MAERSNRSKDREPTVAPGMDTHNPLDKPPTEAERSRGDTTEVTRLYLDRTPAD